MDISINRVHTAILFSLLFISLGFMAPMTYAAYAPESNYLEVHDFEASNATTADSQHLICLDRTVYEANPAKIYTELYLVTEDDRIRVEVDSFTMERYFQRGRTVVKTTMPLSEHVQAGEYRYVMVVQMELAEGRVDREFEHRSDTFTITQSNNTTNITTADYSC